MNPEIPTPTQTMPATKENKGDSSFLKQLLIVAFSAIAMYYLFDKKGYVWFSWHFISMITGFILLPGANII
jgi:hypothetical protein